MNRIVVLLCLCILPAFHANAQLDGLLRKAAQKATEKVSKTAEEAINKELNKNRQNNDNNEAETISEANMQQEQVSYLSLMKQLPALPTAEQLSKFKEAELNEQTLKMMTSPVTVFRTKATSLAMQATQLLVSDMDSAQLVDMAYRQASLSTGLSRAELDQLATMSDEEQEAFIKARMQQNAAMTAADASGTIQSAEELVNLIEPFQPLIDQWEAIGKNVDAVIDQAHKKCLAIYAKYASTLNSYQGKNDKEYNKSFLAYYNETVPIMLTAVQEALRIRQQEQLPVAESIEQGMAPLRQQNPNALSLILNYPQMTTQAFFADLNHLWTPPIPEN